MKGMLKFIAVIASIHFFLWWLAIGFWAFGFLRLISFPLISIADASWPPSNWFIFILRLALNSSIWGISSGLLFYGIRRLFQKPAA
jgi:hypothetical protein